MKISACIALAAVAAIAAAQDHGFPVPSSLRAANFLVGKWVGQMEFVFGAKGLVAEVVTTTTPAVGGRYIEERLRVSLPGRPESETLHMLSYDERENLFKAWWFNDTMVGPLTLHGSMQGDKLVLTSDPTHGAGVPNTVFRVTYTNISADEFTYEMEFNRGTEWTKQFKAKYVRKKD